MNQLIMSVSVYEETHTKKLVAEYDMGKSIDAITKDDWVYY